MGTDKELEIVKAMLEAEFELLSEDLETIERQRWEVAAELHRIEDKLANMLKRKQTLIKNKLKLIVLSENGEGEGLKEMMVENMDRASKLEQERKKNNRRVLAEYNINKKPGGKK